MTEKKNDDLETVRVIAEALEPFTEEERERIIRWSRERIGMPGSQTIESNITSQTPPLAAAPQSIVSNGSRNIKSFVQEKKPRSDVQFATVAAYFYRFEASENEKKETIGAKDLQDAGRQARGYGFKDALKTLTNGVGLGYFDRSGRGEFVLNAVGENLVAMVLPGDADEGKISRKPKAKKKVRKTKGSKK